MKFFDLSTLKIRVEPLVEVDINRRHLETLIEIVIRDKSRYSGIKLSRLLLLSNTSLRILPASILVKVGCEMMVPILK